MDIKCYKSCDTKLDTRQGTKRDLQRRDSRPAQFRRIVIFCSRIENFKGLRNWAARRDYRNNTRRDIRRDIRRDTRRHTLDVSHTSDLILVYEPPPCQIFIIISILALLKKYVTIACTYITCTKILFTNITFKLFSQNF